MSNLAQQTRQKINDEARSRVLVRFWLYSICILVFVMVIVGGATRLTDSGLSITEWKPIMGAIPPLSLGDWQEAFQKYQKIPEFQVINQDMTLGQFKFIFWWEWGHRFLGRLIGLAVLLPMVYFWVSGKLEEETKPRLLLLFMLGGLQGIIGWWMVSSGLVDRVDVSQYRLAVHLTLAFIIFAWGLWIARGLAPQEQEKSSSSIRLFAPLIVIAIFIQVFLGALVAGQHAGLAFNDWPLMDGAIIPTGLTVLDPLWLNAFENPKAVQFIHRIAAYILLLLITVQLVMALISGNGSTYIKRAIVMFLLGICQAAIGVITLVLQVPLFWALLHQAGAVILLAFAVVHWRGLKGSYPTQTT